MVEKEIAKGIICHNKTANQIYFYNEENIADIQFMTTTQITTIIIHY